jgi:YesN/AraC family two-component response regulator
MEKVGAKSVLLVDDQQNFLAALATRLGESSNNFSILTAGNGNEALRILESNRVGVVVTDLKMPVMDGFDLISHIKKRYPGIPVIVLSSFLYQELEPRLTALGVSLWIEKASLDIGVLEEMIIKSW